MQLQYKDPSNPSTWWTIDHFEVSYANKIRYNHIQSHVANRVDPRSSRWGSLYSTPAGWPYYPGAPWADASYTMYRFHTGATATPSFSSFPIPSPQVVNWPLTTSYTASQAPGWTGFSTPAQIGLLQANSPSSAARYTDPDGVLRGGDARYAASGNAPGWPMLSGNNDSRPGVLIRPFRSVAELGNVFRDTPWRNLDFMSPESGDRALLDVFCVNETPADTVVAGKVNLNTRQIPVVAALIRGASLATGSSIDQATANSAAAMLVDWTRSTAADQGPLRDRSELVGRFISGTNFKGPLEGMADRLVSADRPIKASREAIVRGLADAGSTRTWNVLVDVIAQSGQVTAAGLFITNGESRIWHSVAIDRLAATILDKQTETIRE